MTNSSLPSCPFIPGPMITDPQFFVGRKTELEAITSRMTGAQPISINIVGKRSIGKSSLLYHFFQTYEQRVQNPNRYVGIYLDLQNSQCHDEIDFYHAVARQLFNQPKVRSQRSLTRPFQVTSFDRQAFSAVLGEWKRQGVLPVLCLDEFEALFHHPKQFDAGFFDNLRFLINGNSLMLVVASHRKLDFYGKRYNLTSSFFNLAYVLTLGELTEEEARELVSLPAKTGAPAALRNDEQRLARQWGGCHPYLLQLAGSLLWEARQQKQKVGWAKAKFEQQARRIPKGFWNITSSAKYFGKTVSGIALLILVVAVVVSLVKQTQVLEALQKVLGKW
ncbi:ATP-binding protein [Planktothrix sp. FACHB-1355]|uniref:ATP-binding protein n=1 Tax=Aerosakkonema funiforme FACHB-1375 TaxID=2949571 RepID=A0A926VKM5_9CYAN|nr:MULTISPECIES: AAA-like domain-containing protein [Oscillatoriales]MBD2185621.1 ATP-binding protein [Aerosakkonema funiforme FACHB-1375]MBD3561258.1 ATP-binding protein [Planktothrix sp. FACHB-1355]